MKVIKEWKGVNIYQAAKTHPGSKTTALAVFTEDLPGWTGKSGQVRYRYMRNNGKTFTEALCSCLRIINQHVQK